MAVPPLQLPILKDSKEDSLCGEVQYRLGGQFWPAKCIARLHGDLLLIQRAGKQQAAVALHGASVELRAQGTVCIEAPGSPLLALRLETEEEAERWWKELKKAAHRAKGFKDLVSSGNVPLMLSPRSEAEWNEAEQRMERLRLQLAAEQNAKVEIEDRFGETLAAQEAEKEARKTEEELRQEAQQKAEDLQKQLEALSEQFTATASEKDMAHVQVNQMKTEAEQLEQELKALQAELSETGTRLAQVEGKNAGLQDRTKLLEEALENEQEKRVQSEAKVRELQQKQSLESAKLAEVLAVKETTEVKLLDSERQVKVLKDKLAAERQELERIEAARWESRQQDATHTGQLASLEATREDLGRKLSAADLRLQAAESCRKAAEERSKGAETRLVEAEEELQKKIAEIFALQRQLLTPVSRPQEVEEREEELRLVSLKASAALQASEVAQKAAEQRAEQLQVELAALKLQLDKLGEVNKDAKMDRMHSEDGLSTREGTIEVMPQSQSEDEMKDGVSAFQEPLTA